MDNKKIAFVLTCLVVVVLAFALSFFYSFFTKPKSQLVSAKTSISYAPVNDCERKTRILIVHHGNSSDLFWKEVTEGFQDAEKITNSELTLLESPDIFDTKIMKGVGYDGLLVTIPFVENTPEYEKTDQAIKFIMSKHIPVITFNTDTYHNKNAFMYIGSFNKLLGVRGARLAQEKFEKEAIDTVVFLFQESFNVTLNWRAESFEKEFSSFRKKIKFVKHYKSDSLEKVVSDHDGRILLVPLGVMRLNDAVNMYVKYPSKIFICEVGDTGEVVSKLSRDHQFPYVGQQAYHQGYSSVTSMCNIINNYAHGKAWSREKGNSANTVEATYECIGKNCNNNQEEITILNSERKKRSEWIQIGVAICLNRLDIAAWSEYRDELVGKENVVYESDGSQIFQTIAKGDKNFEGELEGESKKGALDEFIKYYPLYERSLDSSRNKFEYFIIVDNGTRLPLSEKNGVPRLRTGMFLRLKYAHITYKIVLYDEDDLENIQNFLIGSLGNQCKPCK